MRVRVRYFAVIREKLGGVGEEELVLPSGSNIGDALAVLIARHAVLGPLVPHLAVAVNLDNVPREHALCDGDELALLPPVAGGSEAPAPGPLPAKVHQVLERPIALADVVDAVGSRDQGATVTFTGVVRQWSRGHKIERIEYEAYREMAEHKLAEIVADVERQVSGARCAIVHRVGTLSVGEVAVVIAVSAPHRAEAFEGCRMAIERLKESVPIWKKEFADDGGSWIGLGP